jgi:hypothetical protein
MQNRLRALALAVLSAAALAGTAAPSAAQSDILLRLRSGSPLGDRVRVDSAGGFIAMGQIGIGIIPATGTGWRMMWYPFKTAFRAGYVDAGGQWDDANVGFYSWAGGALNTAAGNYSFAMGNANTIDVNAQAATLFGSTNHANGTSPHIGQFGFAAGQSNEVQDAWAVAMGYDNNADGDATLAVGYKSTANADYSMAFGYRASTNLHAGAKVFSDASIADSMLATANNEFAVRAAGGFRFRSNATQTTGCNLPAGSGVFSCASSRTLKDHFAPVDGEEVLARMREVPVNFWSYTAEGAQVRHVGPFAEDFHAAFGVGVDDRSIGLLDIDGVNFAGVKALEARTADQAERIRQLETQVAELKAMVQTLVAAQQAPAAGKQ